MSGEKPLVACITGPTATGKTDAAVAVCRALGGEVISMDSMQIYKELSIGTAKPSIEQMGGVPHHQMSITRPDTAYNAAAYQQDAAQAMEDILSRGLLPVFAGGTGLYLQAVSHPLRFADAGGDSNIRAQFEAEAMTPGGPERLLARLEKVDPQSAARLHVNNTRRVIRALEVYALTGEPMSDRRLDWEAEPAQDWLIFALNWPRETLYKRINERVDDMVSRGLVEEVRGLLDAGVPRGAQSMQAIGYKEIVSMLDGELTLEEAVEAIKLNSRRYAKRQLTWLRRDNRIRWLDLSAFTSRESVYTYLIDQIVQYRERNHAGH